MRPALSDDPMWKAETQRAQCVFESARLSITIIAVARILLETKGRDRMEAAQDILKKKKHVNLPAALQAELEKAAQHEGPASKA